MSKITIIIAVYNVEKYIIKCLESVQKQTFSDFECLVISDGSKDTSIDLAKKFISNDSRFRIIEKENGGYGSVLEKGIAECNSKYFIICDPDDYFTNDALEHLYNIAEENDADLVCGARIDVYSDNCEQVYNSIYDTKKYKFGDTKVFAKGDKCFPQIFTIDCSPHSKLFKKTSCYTGAFPHYVAHTDAILFTCTMSIVNKVVYTSKACSYYLLEREGNSMTANKDKFVFAHLIVLKQMLEHLANSKNPEVYICVLDTFRYICSNLKFTNNRGDYKNELVGIFNCIYNNRETIIRYLNYCQGGFPERISNMLLFNSLSSKVYLKLYLNKCS